MDANERRAIELAQQAYQQIRAIVRFLAERYGRQIIADCEFFVDSATAQALAEQVIAEAVRNFDKFQGDDLEWPLRTKAAEMARAKAASMAQWKADEGSPELELKGETVKEKEDFALVRLRKRTNFTWKQIAELVGMTEGQARVRYHRALLDRPELKNVR